MRTPVHVGRWKSGVQVVWRSLALSEYRLLASVPLPPLMLYTAVYEKCVVEGPSLEQVPAGIAVFIGKSQMEGNPFSGKYDVTVAALNKARSDVASSYLESVRAVVAATFRYSFEELDSWPPELLFHRLAQAELLTGVPIQPKDPNKPDKARRAAYPTQATNGPPRPKQAPSSRPEPEIESEQYSWSR